jgi:hypothetical protein
VCINDPKASHTYWVARSPTRERATRPPGLRFRAVMTEGGTQVNVYCEGFDRLGEVSV